MPTLAQPRTITTPADRIEALLKERAPKLVRMAAVRKGKSPAAKTGSRTAGEAKRVKLSQAESHLVKELSREIRSILAEEPAGVSPSSLFLAQTIEHILPMAREKHSELAIEKLVDVLIETHDPLSRVAKEVDAANAEARVRFMEKIATLNSENIADGAGHKAANRSQTASRWKAERRIFSVLWQGQDRYPSFQFEDGRPRPVIAKVLQALPSNLTSWQIAFWFVSANGYLAQAAPFQKLKDEQALVFAAQMLGEEVIG